MSKTLNLFPIFAQISQQRPHLEPLFGLLVEAGIICKEMATFFSRPHDVFMERRDAQLEDMAVAFVNEIHSLSAQHCEAVAETIDTQIDLTVYFRILVLEHQVFQF